LPPSAGRAAIDRYLSRAGSTAANPPQLRAALMGRTDGPRRTLDSFIEPAAHAVWAVPIAISGWLASYSTPVCWLQMHTLDAEVRHKTTSMKGYLSTSAIITLEWTSHSFTQPVTVSIPELSMGWVDPWVGLGWVGLGRDISGFGGLGWVGSTIAKVGPY